MFHECTVTYLRPSNSLLYNLHHANNGTALQYIIFECDRDATSVLRASFPTVMGIYTHFFVSVSIKLQTKL